MINIINDYNSVWNLTTIELIIRKYHLKNLLIRNETARMKYFKVLKQKLHINKPKTVLVKE